MTDQPHQRPGRVPPHNLDAESSLLGAMLLARDATSIAVEKLRSADFYKPAHQFIFDAIADLYGGAMPIDPVTVAERLERSGQLELAGGLPYLLDLQASTPATTSAARYATIVEERALLRALISTSSEIAELGYSVPDDVTKTLDEAESKMFALADRRVVDSTRPIKELLNENLDRLEELFEGGQSITGLPTGYIDLDEMMSGLQPSTLNIVGARPSMGKTAFALGMASHAAMNAAKPVLFFSLEMGHLELTQRMLCSEARVDSSKMRTGQLAEDDWSKITRAVSSLAETPVWIDDNPHLTVMEIAAKARRMKSKVGELGMVVVDYLQLMQGRSSAESRQVEIAEISRGLKVLARELEAPVVALSQLSRNLEARQDKRPMLSDLRESGSLEQDADVVMFLYRDEVYDSNSPEVGTCEVIVAKHRNGPVGTIKLAFLGRYTRFANMAKGL